MVSLGTATRLPGWEARLIAVIESARHKPYVLGEHDCFRLACACIEALTGVDRWADFAGTYRTKREALVAIARHGGSFEDAGDWFFQVPRIRVISARRGDLVALQDELGEKHLAVCVGERVAYMRDGGLDFVRIDSPALICAWRVG